MWNSFRTNIKISLNRRQVLIAGGSALLHSKSNACAFGDNFIKYPLSEVPGSLGFSSIASFLVNTHPKLSNHVVSYSRLLDIKISPLAEDTSRRSLSIRLNEATKPLEVTTTLFLILQHTISIPKESLHPLISFEIVASFCFKQDAFLSLNTLIKSHNPNSILYAAIDLETQYGQQLIINQSPILKGDPCISYQYY